MSPLDRRASLPRTPLKRISEKMLKKRGGKVYSTIQSKPRKPVAKRGAKKVRREASNAAFYKSAEWKAKRKAVFARDGFRCTEMWSEFELTGKGSVKKTIRCPNHRGDGNGTVLHAEETSYNHRGILDAIERIRTRCQYCDRKRTPQERANWMKQK